MSYDNTLSTFCGKTRRQINLKERSQILVDNQIEQQNKQIMPCSAPYWKYNQPSDVLNSPNQMSYYSVAPVRTCENINGRSQIG